MWIFSYFAVKCKMPGLYDNTFITKRTPMLEFRVPYILQVYSLIRSIITCIVT